MLDPSQLLRQADTIADLVQQREYLTRQVEEERSRWESEKEGWDRMSEALLVRQSRKVNGPDESVRAAHISVCIGFDAFTFQELKRICQSLEYDNTALKEKVGFFSIDASTLCILITNARNLAQSYPEPHQCP